MTVLPAQRTSNRELDRTADLDFLAEHVVRDPVTGPLDGDERHDVVDPAGFDIVGVEPVPRQPCEEAPPDLEPNRRLLAGRTGCHGVDAFTQPYRGTAVELGDVGGDSVDRVVGTTGRRAR